MGNIVLAYVAFVVLATYDVIVVVAILIGSHFAAVDSVVAVV